MDETAGRTKGKRAGERCLFWFGAAFTICAPVVIGAWLKDPSTAWVAALCGAFITFISKLDEVAELSLGPVKARMRETIEEAAATIDQVHAIAKNISETTLTALMAGNFGFSDGLTSKARLDLHDRLVHSLEELGVPNNEIESIDARWRQGIGVIYHRAIAPLIDGREEPHLVNADATEEQKRARAGWDELLEFDDWKAPMPDEMTKYLATVGFLTDQINEWIADYRHFLETGEINRREEFVTK